MRRRLYLVHDHDHVHVPHLPSRVLRETVDQRVTLVKSVVLVVVEARSFFTVERPNSNGNVRRALSGQIVLKLRLVRGNNSGILFNVLLRSCTLTTPS